MDHSLVRPSTGDGEGLRFLTQVVDRDHKEDRQAYCEEQRGQDGEMCGDKAVEVRPETVIGAWGWGDESREDQHVQTEPCKDIGEE